MKRNLTLALLLAVTTAAIAAEWKQKTAPVMTRWAKDVTPENVLPEYPRPQMVRDNWTNLNGLWNYAIVSRDLDKPTEWAGEILVPYCAESALSGVKEPVLPQQCLWYEQSFDVPAMKKGERLLLHFGAVDWQATVWVNGTKVGTHRGGFDPFSYDVTDALCSETMKVTVKVWDPTDTLWQPKGKQVLKPGGIMYNAVTGIWQTVWAEVVPATHIENVKVTPDVDSSSVFVTVTAPKGTDVKVVAKDGGKTIGSASGKAGEKIAVKIKNAKLWSPDSPNLYDLEVKLVGDWWSTLDKVQSYFGMRKIEVKKDEAGINRLFLNNEALFQFGPLDQGWWPESLLTPTSEAAMVYDIKITKKLGFNMARKHAKYEPARWYYLCDKMGLLVWQDVPQGETGRNNEAKANFLNEAKAMVDALYNFPCIVMWVPFNEGWGQHDTEDIVKWMQDYDPTRLINEASGWNDHGTGDISDMHNYPGPGMREPEENRASVLGEYGGLGLPIKGHLWQEDRNWGYISYKNSEELTDAYIAQLKAMRLLIARGLSAAVYTQTSDVEVEVNGLMTYDREVVKLDVDRVAAEAAKLYLAPPTITKILKTSREQGHEWAYTTEKPDDNWFAADFDDTAWKKGEAGFGYDVRGASIRTEWKSDDIWIRRSFDLEQVPPTGDVAIRINHDDDAEVYINGKLVQKMPGCPGGYKDYVLIDQIRSVIKPGKNSIAIHCRNTGGVQFIDAGLCIIED
jgi:hypothetical protein